MRWALEGFHFNDMWDMVFNVSEPTVLESVEVLAETSFSIGVYIRDASGATVFEDNYALQSGWNTLDFGVEIPNGTGFQMGIDGTNDGLFRNNAVPAGTFPIAVADRMSITATPQIHRRITIITSTAGPSRRVLTHQWCGSKTRFKSRWLFPIPLTSSWP